MFQLNYYPDNVTKATLNNSFRYWHAESLLNQAAGLIDRCLNDMKELNALAALEFNFMQEITLSEKELEIEESKLDAFNRDTYLNTTYINSLQEMWYDRTTYYKKALDDLWYLNAHIITEYNDDDRNLKIAQETVSGYERRFAYKMKDSEIEIAKRKKLWADDDKVKAEDYFKLRKKILQEKKEQLEKNKILDFRNQADLVWQRLMSNYEDCLNRCIVSERGINLIYGETFLSDEPFALEKLIKESSGIQLKLNNLYIWVYTAIKKITSYSQLEQSFTLSLSLKSLLSEEEFTELQKQDEYHEIYFEVPTNRFPLDTHDNIKFKGIGASLIGDVGKVPWKMEIKLPDFAVYYRGGQSYIVEQDNIPACVLGRVENRESYRSIEYCGLISLNNASPIGEGGNFWGQGGRYWTLKITKPALAEESFKNIKDIIFEINLNGKL